LNAHAQPQRAGIEFLPQAIFDRLDLRCSRGLVGRGARRRNDGWIVYGLTEYQSAGGGVTSGGAVIDQRAAVLVLQESRHIRRTNLHFQRRGNAIEGLQAAARGILPVLVQVDETRRDDETLGIQHAFAGQGLRRDAHDPALSEAYVADGIDARFRIHHAAALKHDVVGLRKRRSGEK